MRMCEHMRVRVCMCMRQEHGPLRRIILWSKNSPSNFFGIKKVFITCAISK